MNTPLNFGTTLIGVALVLAAALAPGLASADYVLDTGTPASGVSVVLNTSDWYAAEFTVTAGETLTPLSLSAYLTQGTGQVGDTFTWEIYSASGTFLNANSSTRESNTFSTQGVFSANGWNTAALDWTPTTAGNYWVALQVTSTSQTHGLDLPTETSATTGTAPALAFASATGSTNPKFQLETNNPVGIQITPVPLPAAVWLLGSGLLGFGGAMRRRETRRQPA